jgi:hypothetical protein
MCGFGDNAKKRIFYGCIVPVYAALSGDDLKMAGNCCRRILKRNQSGILTVDLFCFHLEKG